MLLLVGALVVTSAVLAVIVWRFDRWLGEERQEQSDQLLDGSADPADFDIAMRSCRSSGQETSATIHVTNRADESAAYRVQVTFTGPRGFVLDSVGATSRPVAPGAPTNVTIRTHADGTGQLGTRCEIAEVDNATV